MHIRRVAVHDTDEFDRFYAVWRTADQFERERPATPSRAEAHALFSRDVSTEIFEGFAGFVGHEIVCTGYINYSAVDNLDLISVHVATDPDLRGRGHGSEMLAHLVSRGRELGRHTLLAQAWIPSDQRNDHPYLRFAAAHGFAVANVEVRRLLDLPVDPESIDGWIDASAPHHGDYRVSTYVGKTPGDLIPSLCHVMNQLGVVAPTGDIEFEPKAITPEVFAAREQRSAAAGKVMLRALAVDGAGRVVGFSSLAIPTHEDDVVYQYGTLVLREHRGHRLGMAMKATSLRTLQEQFSDRTYIDTLNAEQNGPMTQINDVIGYRPVELRPDLQRVITD